MTKIKKRNFVIMQEGEVSTIYSLKLDIEKLLDIVENITRIYAEKVEYHEENGVFNKGVNKVFTPNGIRIKHPEKGYYFYEYPILAKSLVVFIKKPSELSQLDETIKTIKESVPQNNGEPVFENGLEYLQNIISAIKKKEYGTCPNKYILQLKEKLSVNEYFKTGELTNGIFEKPIQGKSLLNYVRNYIFDLSLGKSRLKK